MKNFNLLALVAVFAAVFFSSVPCSGLQASAIDEAVIVLIDGNGGGHGAGGSNYDNSIPAGILQKILHQAAPLFGLTYEEFSSMYDKMQVTITKVGPKTYKVEFGGGVAILILDGNN